MNKFSKLAWFNLVWTILVILWGAVVRATNSGAGCGNYWPLCGQSLIPTFDVFHTYVEFTHRVMSGILLITIFIMFMIGRKRFKNDPLRRRLNFLVFCFLIVEALLGAGLVVFELVEDNDSIFRIIAISLHLLNTFILVGLTSLNAFFVSNSKIKITHLTLKGAFKFILLFILVIGVSGAVTSLADTVYPPKSFTDTMTEWVDPQAHLLQRLRPYHPLIAGLLGLGILGYINQFSQLKSDWGKKLRKWIHVFIFIQFGLGSLNIVLHAPLTVQILHLLFADLIWITAIYLAFTDNEENITAYEK